MIDERLLIAQEIADRIRHDSLPALGQLHKDRPRLVSGRHPDYEAALDRPVHPLRHHARRNRAPKFFHGGMTNQRRATLIAQTANGRAGSVADIAGTMLFLAPPAANHITGQTIHVNGGAL